MKNAKEEIINQTETRMAKIGEDWDGLQTTNLKNLGSCGVLINFVFYHEGILTNIWNPTHQASNSVFNLVAHIYYRYTDQSGIKNHEPRPHCIVAQDNRVHIGFDGKEAKCEVPCWEMEQDLQGVYFLICISPITLRVPRPTKKRCLRQWGRKKDVSKFCTCTKTLKINSLSWIMVTVPHYWLKFKIILTHGCSIHTILSRFSLFTFYTL